MNKSQEADLLARLGRFDMQALAEAYDTFSPSLYAYSMRLLRDAQQAEDCVAETFSRLLGALQAGNGPREYLQAYLYRTAHNWITDQYRRQPLPALPLDEVLQLHSHSSTEREAEEKVEQEQVRAAFLCLSPDQRQVVMLKFVEGWENEAVAAALQKPIGAIKSLQHRALGALKRMLIKKDETNYEVIR